MIEEKIYAFMHMDKGGAEEISFNGKSLPFPELCVEIVVE
jgi:hypothetical protein